MRVLGQYQLRYVRPRAWHISQHGQRGSRETRLTRADPSQWRGCSRPRGRAADTEEVRDDDDERDDEKDVDQPTGCRYGDKSEEPQHQNHAGDYEQHVPDLLSRIATTGHDTSPRTVLLGDRFVMPADAWPAVQTVISRVGGNAYAALQHRVSSARARAG